MSTTSYEVSLLRREEPAEGTASFFFDRPAGLEFHAGQFIEVTLQRTDGQSEDLVRTFSIATAPYEDAIMVTTRLRAGSDFKQQLAALRPGDRVRIDGPYGSFVLPDELPRPLVLVAGGVGITPLRSIIRHLKRTERLDETYLFYANRRPQAAAFLDELAEVVSVPGEFTLIPTMTGLTEADTGWKGEKGRLSPEMLMRYVQTHIAAYYVAGPPAMVDATRQMLAEMGIERERVRVERFKGYDQ